MTGHPEHEIRAIRDPDYLRQHEFSATYGIRESDTEPLTLDELLTHAGPERRQQFERLRLGYTETKRMTCVGYRVRTQVLNARSHLRD